MKERSGVCVCVCVCVRARVYGTVIVCECVIVKQSGFYEGRSQPVWEQVRHHI